MVKHFKHFEKEKIFLKNFATKWGALREQRGTRGQATFSFICLKINDGKIIAEEI